MFGDCPMMVKALCPNRSDQQSISRLLVDSGHAERSLRAHQTQVMTIGQYLVVVRDSILPASVTDNSI